MSLKSLYSSFRQPPSEAGHGVAFLKLARAQRRRWEVLGEFAKYAFCGLKRKRRDFERSVLKYVSIKIPALTHSGRKSRVCVNQPDRLLPPEQRASPPLPFFKSKSSMHSALQARRFAFRRSWDACAARDYARKMSDYFYFFAALRAHYFTFRRSGGRLCGAQQGGAGYGASPPSRPPLHPPRNTP